MRQPARKPVAAASRRRTAPAEATAATPKVVYTQAPVQLGVALAAEGALYRVRVGATERTLALDPAVDPALVDEAIRTGARVVLDAGTGGDPVVVGVLATARALRIERDGAVDATVRAFTVSAREAVTLKTTAAFLALTRGEVELYGQRVMTRARELVRILGSMIKLN